jgi:hypothetical protein
MAEEYQILCLRGDDETAIDLYEQKYLFSDEEADIGDCTLKQTSHFAGQIASKMVEYLTNHCNNLGGGNERLIPFFTHYNAETGVYNVVL